FLPPAEVGPRFPSGAMRATEGEYVASEPPARTIPTGPPVAPAELVPPRALPTSASVARDLPYRRGPGEIPPEDVNAPDPFVLGGYRGVRVPPRATPKLLSGAYEPAAPAETTPRLQLRPHVSEIL